LQWRAASIRKDRWAWQQFSQQRTHLWPCGDAKVSIKTWDECGGQHGVARSVQDKRRVGGKRVSIEVIGERVVREHKDELGGRRRQSHSRSDF
jgi:hypothetical protein